MLDLPYNEPYWDKDLIEVQYYNLIQELKLRAMFKEVTPALINKNNK